MAPLPSGGYNTATQCAESEMQPVAEAVTISMRLGYTLAPLAAMPPTQPPNTHHRFPSLLGDPLDTPLLPASLSENLQSGVSERPPDPNEKIGSFKGFVLVMLSSPKSFPKKFTQLRLSKSGIPKRYYGGKVSCQLLASSGALYVSVQVLKFHPAHRHRAKLPKSGK